MPLFPVELSVKYPFPPQEKAKRRNYITMLSRETVAKVSLIGFLFTALAGGLLHFAFAASGGNTLVGAFTPVNESVWEHLKLLLFPAVAFSAVEYFVYGKSAPAFFAAKSVSTLVGLAAIITLFYTYTGIAGRNYLAADISVFIAAAALSYYLTYLFMNSRVLSVERANIIGITLIAAVIILFIYFTFNPPMCELFRDPVSDDFGIPDCFYAFNTY